MNTKTICFLISMALFLAISTGSHARSKGVTCEVKSIKENTVTLDCGDKASKLEVGKKVTVKKAKQKKALEGC